MAAQHWFRRIFLVVYDPDPSQRGFLARAQTQNASGVEVTVAVPDARESEKLFGVALARRGLQPIHVTVVNRSENTLRLHFRSLDPHYYPPLEAAARCHFSILKRLYAFGIFAWYFLPLLMLSPFKLWAVHRANQKMDALFQSLAFHRRPIVAGGTSEGFVFASFDVGTKMVRVQLVATGKVSSPDSDSLSKMEHAESTATITIPNECIDLLFTISVPGINADYLHKKLDSFVPSDADANCDLPQLIQKLKEVSVTTSNLKQTGSGDPVNLVVIGGFENLLNAFTGRWDETEIISLATCWKTARAFLLGSEYRYSPVSSLYLFGRSQDIALQHIRQ